MDNLAKIKAELDLNSFLSPGDERDVAEGENGDFTNDRTTNLIKSVYV